MNQEMSGGEIGLGGLEDMMDKADGGATPDFVKSLGVKELDDVFAILGSQTKGAELGQLVLSEKFGETLYRESGFTSLAETINGRCAVRWRVARVASFDGDYASRIAMGGRGRARESGDVRAIERRAGVGIDGLGGEGERERRVRRDGRASRRVLRARRSRAVGTFV